MKPILSVVWAAGKLGAAHYDTETGEFFLLPDISETAPYFDILKLLFEQVDPSYLIASARQDERFTAVLKELCGEKDIEAEEPSSRVSSSQYTISSQQSSTNLQNSSSTQSPSTSVTLRHTLRHSLNIVPFGAGAGSGFGSGAGGRGEEDESQIDNDHEEEEKCHMLLLPGKDFAPDPCKARLQSQRLPEEPKTFNEAEHLVYITALIPFRNTIMVRAAGALLRFLDKNGIEHLQIELVDGRVPIKDIRICQMDNLVIVDETAWNSLQIFSSEYHPAVTKGNLYSSTKEGLSVFSLLNKCASAHGSKFLRQTLRRPTRSLSVLKRRHDVVAFCHSPLHLDFVKSSKDCLKSIKSFPKLLYKLSILHASDKEWMELYQSIYHCLILTEIVSAQSSYSSIELFHEISDPAKKEILKTLSLKMNRVVDFEESREKGRFVPKAGINEELDRKRKQFAHLPLILARVANDEMKVLPEFVQQCRMVYIPEVGYLLAINFWLDNLSVDDLQLEGFDLHFTTHDVAYYKSARAKELDEILGDIQVSIIDMETTILISLAQEILEHKQDLLKIGILASELDCLMGMSAAAQEYNYVRPDIIDGGGNVEIKDGRHPLVDTITDADFVPNSTSFEGSERVVILTGPNASGKSIYLKQVGVIVLMALSGSFVPASFARIPTFDRICTRIHAKESVSDGMSTFLIDISQMANAIRTATKASLVIVDEFGKGTAEADGLGLLVATIQDFIAWDDKCPTIFLSTHFYSIMRYMEVSSAIKLQTMEFVQEDNDIVYLYKLKNGICKSSLSHLIAAKVGISDEIIQRSLEIHNILSNNLGDEHIKPWSLGEVSAEKKETYIRIGREFRDLDFEDPSFDFHKYMEYLGEQLAPFLPKFSPEPSRANSPVTQLFSPNYNDKDNDEREQGQRQVQQNFDANINSNFSTMRTPTNNMSNYRDPSTTMDTENEFMSSFRLPNPYTSGSSNGKSTSLTSPYFFRTETVHSNSEQDNDNNMGEHGRRQRQEQLTFDEEIPSNLNTIRTPANIVSTYRDTFTRTDTENGLVSSFRVPLASTSASSTGKNTSMTPPHFSRGENVHRNDQEDSQSDNSEGEQGQGQRQEQRSNDEDPMSNSSTLRTRTTNNTRRNPSTTMDTENELESPLRVPVSSTSSSSNGKNTIITPYFNRSETVHPNDEEERKSDQNEGEHGRRHTQEPLTLDEDIPSDSNTMGTPVNNNSNYGDPSIRTDAENGVVSSFRAPVASTSSSSTGKNTSMTPPHFSRGETVHRNDDEDSQRDNNEGEHELGQRQEQLTFDGNSTSNSNTMRTHTTNKTCQNPSTTSDTENELVSPFRLPVTGTSSSSDEKSASMTPYFNRSETVHPNDEEDIDSDNNMDIGRISLYGDSDYDFDTEINGLGSTPQDIFVSNEEIRLRSGFGMDLLSIPDEGSSLLDLLYDDDHCDDVFGDEDDLEDIGASASNFGGDDDSHDSFDDLC